MKQRVWITLVLGLLIALTACSSAATESPNPGPYTFDLTTADFVDVVDNPYYPLIPGTKWVYEAQFKDGTVERNEVEVLTDTRLVNGVTATVVHDIIFVEGEIAEETYDWYAQDKEGNVWYLGEDVDNYEGGVLSNHAGSWEWGVDGALPGVIMWADPSAHRNEEYFQEFYAGKAEDKGQVLSVAEEVSIPFGSFQNVLRTRDFSAIDPNLNENKFYASGIGMIKEIDLATGEEVVLIEFNQRAQ
ncbi:MAG: hypothetical protein AB1649_09290 [Chloroflexota bacterium]